MFLFIDYLRYKNYEFYMAPYEADSQLAYMFIENIIDGVISEDSDMIAYGVTKIIKPIKMEERARFLDLEIHKNQKFSSKDLKTFYSFS